MFVENIYTPIKRCQNTDQKKKIPSDVVNFNPFSDDDNPQLEKTDYFKEIMEEEIKN